LNLRYRGPNRIPCRAVFEKGEELGYFQHGSTVVVLASGDLMPAEGLGTGAEIRVGQPLFRRRPRAPTPEP
jgi:phosphatidylserine decarboxylase